MRLQVFLTSNRQELISRCAAKVVNRAGSAESGTDVAATIDYGVPKFLEQLVETLRREEHTPARSDESQATPAPTAIGRTAALHGADLLRRGFSVDQVVHGYGDVCQCVTALAVEQNVAISTDEFRTLNRCLDNAIADAVASFGEGGRTSNDRQVETWQQRLDAFADEHRRLNDIAIKSLAAIKTGNVGISGATGGLLAHALEELRSLTERTLPELLLATPNAKAAPVKRG